VVDADAEVVEDETADVAADLLQVGGAGREEMEVREEEKRLVLVLEANAVGQGADVVAEVEGLARRAVAGEDAAAGGWLRVTISHRAGPLVDSSNRTMEQWSNQSSIPSRI